MSEATDQNAVAEVAQNGAITPSGRNKRKKNRRLHQRKKRLVVKLTTTNPDVPLTEEQKQLLEKMKKKKQEKIAKKKEKNEAKDKEEKKSKKRKRTEGEQKDESQTKKKVKKDGENEKEAKSKKDKKDAVKQKDEKKEVEKKDERTPEEKKKEALKLFAEKQKIKRRTIIVGNFPFDTTPEQLKEYFTQRAGKVSTVTIQYYKKTGLSKGFAKVAFKNKEAVKKAIAFDSTDYGGRKLYVNIPGRRKQREKETENRNQVKTIHVAGFGDEVTQKDIEEFLKPANVGPIKEVRMFNKVLDGKNHNIAFVQFHSSNNLEAAVKLHGTKLNGRPVKIKYAVEKKRIHNDV